MLKPNANARRELKLLSEGAVYGRRGGDVRLVFAYLTGVGERDYV